MLQISTESDLRQEISYRKQVYALFHASWCPFCQRFIPFFIEREEWGGAYALLVNLDDTLNPLWESYTIDVVPTVIYFEEGKVSRRLNGILGIGLNHQQLHDFLSSLSQITGTRARQ